MGIINKMKQNVIDAVMKAYKLRKELNIEKYL